MALMQITLKNESPLLAGVFSLFCFKLLALY